MTALAFLSSGIFFFLVAISVCRGIVYWGEGKKRYVVSDRFLWMVFIIPPMIYLTLSLIVLWKL